jgi:predicted amidophosphoribosyltransferase
VIDLRTLDRPPAGFGACATCAYVSTGSAPICFAFASEHTEQVAVPRCGTCGLPPKPDGQCGNPICNWGEDERYFDRVWAISMRTGEMRTAINRYKYGGRIGWAGIFGRILVGFLGEHRDEFSSFDVITPSPSYIGAAATSTFDHTRQIVEAAQVEEPIAWPFTFDVIVKTTPTRTMVGSGGWQGRREISEGELRESLKVPDPRGVAGRRILIVDDVFTEGFTIREVARALRTAGAVTVSEIVLAREPWRRG